VTHWFAGRKTPTLEQGLAILEILKKAEKSSAFLRWSAVAQAGAMFLGPYANTSMSGIQANYCRADALQEIGLVNSERSNDPGERALSEKDLPLSRKRARRRTFGNSAAPKIDSCLVNECWGLISGRILQPLLRFAGGFRRAPDATQRLPSRFHHAADLPAQRRRARD
jgi:hypothetical protein